MIDDVGSRFERQEGATTKLASFALAVQLRYSYSFCLLKLLDFVPQHDAIIRSSCFVITLDDDSGT